MTAPTLYHYTCDHGRAQIGHRGVLLPTRHLVSADRRALLPWQAGYVWLTDLDTPMRDALGLTSHILACDRTRHRYRVLDMSDCARWLAVSRNYDTAIVREIESAPGCFPAHWWLSPVPVHAVYDPIGVPA